MVAFNVCLSVWYCCVFFSFQAMPKLGWRCFAARLLNAIFTTKMYRFTYWDGDRETKFEYIFTILLLSFIQKRNNGFWNVLECVCEREKTLFLLVWRKWQHHLPQSLTFQVKAFLFLFVSLSSAKKQKKPFTHPMQFREDLPYQHLVYKQRVNFTNNLHAAFVLISFGPKFQTQTVCT